MRALMRAVVVAEHGGPFRIAEVPVPSPGPGEVLVRIHASGVNPLDTKIRAGKAEHARQPLPAILGMDLAGTVEAIGDGVCRFQLGDHVWGMAGGVGGWQGTLAEFAAVDAALLALRPIGFTAREAAAVPLVFITAWEGLVDRAKVQPGETVLIHGGTGGVGHMAIQIAKALGARVYATDRPTRARYIETLGAVLIDRDMPVEEYLALHTAGRGFDVVYDTVGGGVLEKSFESTRRFGRVVSALGWGTHSLAPLSFRAATYSGVFSLLPILTGEGREHHGGILHQAKRLADSGQLRPRLDPRHFSLDDVAAAYGALERGKTSGKIVVDIGTDTGAP